MINLLLESKFRIWIPGITDKIPTRFQYTVSQDKEGAIRNLTYKITEWVQDPTSGKNKDWTYQDSKFRVKMHPRYARVLAEYLIANNKCKVDILP